MSGGDINILLNLWEASLLKHDDELTFANHKNIYDTIDMSPLVMYCGRVF